MSLQDTFYFNLFTHYAFHNSVIYLGLLILQDARDNPFALIILILSLLIHEIYLYV